MHEVVLATLSGAEGIEKILVINVDVTNNTVQRGVSGSCGSVPGGVTDFIVAGNQSPGSTWINNK